MCFFKTKLQRFIFFTWIKFLFCFSCLLWRYTQKNLSQYLNKLTLKRTFDTLYKKDK